MPVPAIQDAAGGVLGIFADAGFVGDSHPTLRRVVMRIDF